MSNHGISRRTFVKTVGVAGATVTVGAGAATAAAPATSREEFRGMLIDTTKCIGCRTCEVACAKAKGLPAPDLGVKEVEAIRTTSDRALTVVNRHATKSGYAFLKNQCMHCNQPACASACLTKALLKTESGQVIYRANKCMGCRMCMVSCPFEIPKFEYSSWKPSIMKCDLCYDRTKIGEKPACVEACPAGALTFGTRRELLRIARERVEKNPGTYTDHIYGEHEAGGTGVLYLSRADFTEMGMSPSIGNEPYPKLSKPFLSAVPLIFTVLPVLMIGLNRATRKNDSRSGEERS